MIQRRNVFRAGEIFLDELDSSTDLGPEELAIVFAQMGMVLDRRAKLCKLSPRNAAGVFLAQIVSPSWVDEMRRAGGDRAMILSTRKRQARLYSEYLGVLRSAAIQSERDLIRALRDNSQWWMWAAEHVHMARTLYYLGKLRRLGILYRLGIRVEIDSNIAKLDSMCNFANGRNGIA